MMNGRLCARDPRHVTGIAFKHSSANNKTKTANSSELAAASATWNLSRRSLMNGMNAAGQDSEWQHRCLSSCAVVPFARKSKLSNSPKPCCAEHAIDSGNRKGPRAAGVRHATPSKP